MLHDYAKVWEIRKLETELDKVRTEVNGMRKCIKELYEMVNQSPTANLKGYANYKEPQP